MKFNARRMLTHKILIVALTTIALFSLRVAVGQERGQGVRLRVGSTTGQEVELYGASYALVIGVSDYANGWHDLPGVRDDLPAVKAALEKHGFKVTTVINPTRRQFDDAVGQFVGAYGQRRDHRLLIYFAGHGHTLTTQDGRRELGYIVPADAPLPKANNTGEFKRFAVSMNEINNYAEQIEAVHALFVFDSCFAGTIFKSRSGGVPEAITDKIVQPVRQFITAGSEKQTVPDYSYFRRAFVAALDGAADDSRDGFITGAELGEYLHREVTNYTKRAQTPQHGKIYNPDLNEGDFVFVAPKRETIALVERPKPQMDRCAIAWDSIKATESEQVIENFLAGCKESPQAFAANLRLSELRARRRPAAPDPAPTALTPIIPLPSGLPLSALRSAPITTATVGDDGRVTRQQAGPIQFYQEDLGGGVKLEMVAVPGGRFQMGAPSVESMRPNDEDQHWVRVSDFWIGRYEVTQAQWKAVMSNLPPNMVGLGSEFIGDDLPVVRVSWEEAQEFIRKLNARLSDANYRLPREAEWEFAARAGKSTPFGFGATITPEIVNYNGNVPYGNAAKGKYQQHPTPVGSLGVANAFGLFDMHGNVWEWCEDRYGPYPFTEVADPMGPGIGAGRVYRGGGWQDIAIDCRSARRNGLPPGARYYFIGFRLLRTYR
jgi:formylglycine-generating enzyme required for sulfatase activity